jgi:nucleoside-diphosphate-sugar epimerase
MAAYGQSKFCAEAYCGWYERLHGLSAVTLRYGNVYGPRQDPLGEAGVIAIFCGKLVSGGRPVIYGDGRQTRDYTFVGDVVAANLAAAGHPEAHGVYNVGTGTESSVLEVLGALRRAGGLDDEALQPEFAPARARLRGEPRPRDRSAPHARVGPQRSAGGLIRAPRVHHEAEADRRLEPALHRAPRGQQRLVHP